MRMLRTANSPSILLRVSYCSTSFSAMACLSSRFLSAVARRSWFYVCNL